jgi:hypothetical protein
VTATVNGSGLIKTVVVDYIDGNFDVDEDGDTDANDGVMISRYLGGSRDAAITNNITLPSGKTHSTITAAIVARIDAFNVDEDSDTDANDGVMISRYLGGSRDAALSNNITITGSKDYATVTTKIVELVITQ